MDQIAANQRSSVLRGPASDPIREVLGLGSRLSDALTLNPATLYTSLPAFSSYASGSVPEIETTSYRLEQPEIFPLAGAGDAPPATTPAELYARRPALFDAPVPLPFQAQAAARLPLVLLAAAAPPALEPDEEEDSRSRSGVSAYAVSSPSPPRSSSSSTAPTREALPAGESGSPRDARRLRTRAGAQATARVSMHNVAVESAASAGSRGGMGRVGSGSIDDVGAGIPGAFGSVSDLSRLTPGLRIDNVQLFSGYSSNGVPTSSFYAPGASFVGSDMDVGARATISYRRSGRHSDFSLAYSPAYKSRFRYSQWNSADHVASLGFSREFGARWGFALKSDAGLVGLEQAWIVPPTFHSVLNPPTTIDELMQRAAAGEFTDDEVASLLTGAPVVDDAGGVGLGLSRVARASANVTLSYAHSPRMSMSFAGTGSTYQVLSDNGPERLNFIRRTDYASANANLSYKLDARTTIGVDATSRSIRSNLQQGLTNQLTVSYSKMLRSRWEYSIRAGGGISDSESEFGQIGVGEGLFLGRKSSTPTLVLGGSLSYLGRANRFNLSASRNAGDFWGTGNAALIGLGLEWQWMRPTSSWGLSAGVNHARSVGDQNFRNIESTLMRGGMVQRLSASTLLRTDYIYSRYSSPFRGLVPHVTISRIQATLMWTPRARRR